MARKEYRLPWMPLDVGEYLAETGQLTAEEHGVYLLLQMHYWINGGIPADDRSLAQIARLSLKKWKGMRNTIAPYFEGDWSAHQRINRDLAKARALQETRRALGAIGGHLSSLGRSKRDFMPEKIRENRGTFPTARATKHRQAIASPIAQPIAPHLLEPGSTQSKSKSENTGEQTGSVAAREDSTHPKPHEMSAQEIMAKRSAAKA